MLDSRTYQCRWGFCAKILDSGFDLHQHVRKHFEVAPEIELTGVKRRKIGNGVWVRLAEPSVERSERAMRVSSGLQRISDHLPVHDSQAGDTTTTTETTFPIPSFPSLPPPPSFPELSQMPPLGDTSFSAFEHLDELDSAALLVDPFSSQISETHAMDADVEEEPAGRPGRDVSDEMLDLLLPSPPGVCDVSGKIMMSNVTTGRGRKRSRSSSPFVPPTQAIQPTQLSPARQSDDIVLSQPMSQVSSSNQPSALGRATVYPLAVSPPRRGMAPHQHAPSSPPSVEVARSAVTPLSQSMLYDIPSTLAQSSPLTPPDVAEDFMPVMMGNEPPRLRTPERDDAENAASTTGKVDTPLSQPVPDSIPHTSSQAQSSPPAATEEAPQAIRLKVPQLRMDEREDAQVAADSSSGIETTGHSNSKIPGDEVETAERSPGEFDTPPSPTVLHDISITLPLPQSSPFAAPSVAEEFTPQPVEEVPPTWQTLDNHKVERERPGESAGQAIADTVRPEDPRVATIIPGANASQHGAGPAAATEFEIHAEAAPPAASHPRASDTYHTIPTATIVCDAVPADSTGHVAADSRLTEQPKSAQGNEQTGRVNIRRRNTTGAIAIPMPVPAVNPAVARLSVGFTFGSGLATPPL